MRIALAGNPNSGKTTMYNALTGKNEHVGNWAGVTVDKKTAPIKKNLCGKAELVAVDLPGAYSMSPFTSEESITSAYVKEEKPDAIINIVDATNLSRSLFFTTQLLELGIPVVVALNKSDINEAKETKIDAAKLSEKLGCPVINTVSTSAKGLKDLVAAAASAAGKAQTAPYVQGDIDLTDKAAVEAEDRKRFEFVNAIVAEVETRKVLTKNKNAQDKLDAVLTNKWAGIPIFAVVMFLVFGISQAWVGPFIAEGHEFKNGFTIPGLVTLIDWFGEWVGGLLENAHPLVSSLVVDGIIGGVGAVVGFLPLVMVMYFLIALLEDCGYMARATVVLDPIFKRVGLSGKSVIIFFGTFINRNDAERLKLVNDLARLRMSEKVNDILCRDLADIVDCRHFLNRRTEQPFNIAELRCKQLSRLFTDLTDTERIYQPVKTARLGCFNGTHQILSRLVAHSFKRSNIGRFQLVNIGRIFNESVIAEKLDNRRSHALNIHRTA